MPKVILTFMALLWLASAQGQPAYTISTIAGTGAAGFAGDGGSALSAEISDPRGVALDSAGNLYIADYANNRIGKITPAGTISTFAGNGVQGFSGDGG